MRNKTYHIVRTVPKENLKNEERNKIDTPSTHIQGDGHLSENIHLHCGYLRDNNSGHLSDTITIDLKIFLEN